MPPTDLIPTARERLADQGSAQNLRLIDDIAALIRENEARGALTSFTITGEGLSFITGTSPSDTARIGLPNLTTASLGGVTGRLHTIGSGGTNTIAAGKTAGNRL